MLEIKRTQLEIALKNNTISMLNFIQSFLPLKENQKILLFSIESDLTRISKDEALQNINLIYDLRQAFVLWYPDYVIEFIPRYNNQTLKDIYLKLK